jgi:hypothetical protein
MAKKSLSQRFQKLGEMALPGTLVEVMMRCGKAACGCRNDPSRRHGPHLYLKYRNEEGRQTALYIPRSHEREVRKAVEAWSKMREAMTQLGQENRKALAKKLRSRPRGK